jgi:hypothetical protein
LKRTHYEKRAVTEKVMVSWRGEVGEYNRHTEGDNVSLEGSAVEKGHTKGSVWEQRKLKKATDTEKEKLSRLTWKKGCGMSV